MKTLAEQIRDLENTRAAKMARMDEISQKSIDAGRSFEDAEAEEFDTIDDEIKQIDADLVRLNRLQKLQAANAAPIDDKTRIKTVDDQHRKGPTIIVPKADPEDKFEGQSLVRIAIAKYIAKDEGRHPAQVAMERWGKTHQNLIAFMKGDVAGGGTGSGAWGSELVSNDTYTGDFIGYLYAKTVYNQLPLREVPANMVIKGQDGRANAKWIGEGKAIAVTKPDFNDVLLTNLKVAATSYMSKELVKYGDPSVEMLIRDALVAAAAQRIDQTFISNAAAVSGESPAGILNNIPATTSAGTDSDALMNDITELEQRFIDANNTGGLYFVMSETLASRIGKLRNALGYKEFPDITLSGGSLEGHNVVTGGNVTASHLVLLKPSDIFRIGAGPVEISISDSVTLETSDAPTMDAGGPTAATGKLVNMWQTESVAMKVVQPINFARRRESAVAWISDADYGGAIST